jgi:hypothetical protein
VTSARQSVFRAEYRSRIETWYSGAAHVVAIYALGGLALWAFASRLSSPIRWWQWAVVPAVFLVCNVAEWATHRFVMHRPRRNPIARAIYRRHTLMHHQFFTEKNYSIGNVRDFRIVFFPPYIQAVALAFAAPGSALAGALLGANAGWLSMATVTLLYMIYEFFHFCCHVPDNWFVRNAPFVNTIRRHHIAHHDQEIMMHYNMNLTFPIADWLFGTSDLKRDLLGTLFNGYSQAHLRTNIRRTLPDTALGGPDAVGAE